MFLDIMNALPTSLRLMPFSLLQASAIVGIFCIILTIGRGYRFDLKYYRVYCGLVFGVVGFLLTLLMEEFIQGAHKPYMRNDLLFLGGLLGGLSGGAICYALMLAARLMFAGWKNGLAAGIDMAIIAAGGMVMHAWLGRRSLSQLGFRDILLVWGARVVIALFSLAAITGLGLIGSALFAQAVPLRVLAAPVSLVIIASIFILLRRDTREREAQERQRELDRTDILTGLPNRRALKEHLGSLLQREAPAQHTLILVEVVNMADMVLAHGHEGSDGFWPDVCRHLRMDPVNRLLEPYRPRLFLFSELTLAIVLHGISVETVRETRFAEDLHGELSGTFRPAAGALPPRLRFGVAGNCWQTAKDLPNALRDLSLDNRGGDQPVRFLRTTFAEKVAMDEWLRQSLMQWIALRAPPLSYQPKCEITTGRTVGAEALLRARDFDGNDISPFHIIEIAERYHLLLELEWCTIEAVVRDIALCGNQDCKLRLAVNVSAASLSAPGFGKRVADLLQANGIGGELLSIEVTETSKIPDIVTVHDNLHLLSAIGVNLSLDDFGSGYSALTLLARFPFNEIKIDHSMVARVDQPRMQAAVSLALESASRYNAALVAEGIETPAQVGILTEIGIDLGQGHLYSRAIPLDDLIVFSRTPHPVLVVAAA